MSSSPDPYKLAERFRHYLRVTDVTDGLDAVGLNDLTLMSNKVRPLWLGMRFWGPAVTMQVVPANRHMPFPLKKEDALRQHAIWGEMGGWRARLNVEGKEGYVIVTSTGGARECGWWGSMNSMEMHALGAAGIVTDGYCRDTDEVILQRTPVACAGIGRPIIPGRTELEAVEVPVSCGGVFVRLVTLWVATGMGSSSYPLKSQKTFSCLRRIAIDDKKARRRLYDKLGKEPDETVDWEVAAEYFKDLL